MSSIDGVRNLLLSPAPAPAPGPKSGPSDATVRGIGSTPRISGSDRSGEDDEDDDDPKNRLRRGVRTSRTGPGEENAAAVAVALAGERDCARGKEGVGGAAHCKLAPFVAAEAVWRRAGLAAGAKSRGWGREPRKPSWVVPRNEGAGGRRDAVIVGASGMGMRFG